MDPKLYKATANFTKMTTPIVAPADLIERLFGQLREWAQEVDVEAREQKEWMESDERWGKEQGPDYRYDLDNFMMVRHALEAIAAILPAKESDAITDRIEVYDPFIEQFFKGSFNIPCAGFLHYEYMTEWESRMFAKRRAERNSSSAVK